MTHVPNPADGPEHDLLQEECVPFAKAARKLPKVRGENHPSPSTLWRWAFNGRRSRTGEVVRLEYIKIGGTNCTSMEALARFFNRLRGDDPLTASCLSPDPASPNKPGTSTQNSPEKRAEQATEVLRRRGIVK